MFVADARSIYRVMWCDEDNSLRYHKLTRLKTEKYGTIWWVFYERVCSGLPPVLPGHLPRMVKNCQVCTREWMPASQWNWLIKVDAYAA